MANYEYAEGTITHYSVMSPEVVVLTVSLPYKGGTLKQKYGISYFDFVGSDAGEGTKVLLRLDKDKRLSNYELVRILT
jgi:hypothetical protein